jgi:long-chain fatty acid transport protein
MGNDLDGFGFGARPVSMGGAFTALANDFSAVYYNPAALINSKSLKLHGGYSFADYYLDLDTETGKGEDRAERISDLSAFTLGVSTRIFPHDEDARFAAGLGIFLPTRRILTAFSVAAPIAPEGGTPTSSPPQYIMYGEKRDKIGVYFGGAVRVIDGLSLGAGAALLADLPGAVDLDFINSSVDIEYELEWDLSPNAGIFWQALPGLSLGLTYRGELSLKIESRANVLVAGSPLLSLNVEAITLFSPQQIAFGFAWDPHPDFTVAFDLTWQDWSAYDRPFTVVTPGPRPEDPDFDDTWTPRLGLEYQLTGLIALRMGYYYQPSPVPEQKDLSNLIDNDKHVFSFGVGFTFDTPVAMNIDLFLQWHHLAEEKASKRLPPDPDDPNNPGDFTSGGDILNFGFGITFRL